MIENLRVFFSLVWLFATGALFVSTLVCILTWGDYFDYFLWSAGAWGLSTLGAIATSLE